MLNSLQSLPLPAKKKVRDALQAEVQKIHARKHGTGKALDNSGTPWREWLQANFPNVATAPMASRHIALWEWFDALTIDSTPRPRIEVWGRGGAKSSSGELGVVRVGAKLSRRFVLYVSETQAQAAKHVMAIASLFESMGVDRAVNPYGASKGWSRDMIRTANGFNVAAFGLDTAQRGTKLDQYRPDLIIFDDIDGKLDTVATVEKKIDMLTTAILPAGSVNCAVLGLQNLIHPESIFSRLVDDRADFLRDRYIPTVEPAVIGLTRKGVVLQTDGEDKNEWIIREGVPSWAGQDLDACQRLLNRIGVDAFFEECQHEVQGVNGTFFNTQMLQTIPASDVGELVSVCLAWDMAATENGGDHTVGVLMGKRPNDTYVILSVIRGQWGAERVEQVMDIAAHHFRKLYPKLKIRKPQDPGAAGKILASHMRADDPSAQIKPMSGSKATRAKPFAAELNKGNVSIAQIDLPEALANYSKSLAWSVWHHAFGRVLRNFREDLTKQEDDDVDAGADAYNTLKEKYKFDIL